MNLTLIVKKSLSTAITHYPLPTATICYVAGISAAYWYGPTTTSSLFPSIPLLFAAAAALFAYLKKTGSLLIIFFALLGLSHGAMHLQAPESTNHIYNLVPRRTTLTISGTLRDMPSERDGYTKFSLKTNGIITPDPINNRPIRQIAHGMVKFTLAGRLDPRIAVGDHLLVRASLDRISGYRTPGVFDYRLHMASQGIYVSGFIKTPAAVYPASPIDPNPLTELKYLPEQIRFNLAKFIVDSSKGDHAGVYRALLIGDRSRVSPELTELFIDGGCMHILAISGLHMSLLALVIITAARRLLKRCTSLVHILHVPTISVLFALPPLLVYCFIAGMNTPALRAFLMAALTIFAVVLRRRRTPFHILAAAVLFLTALNPLVVYTVSFQLSVAAVLGIICILPRLTELLSSPSGNTEMAFLQRIFSIVKAGLFISTAATLATLPFVLHHFNRVSLIGPIANLIVEPLLCFWTLPCGLFSSILIALSPALAEFFLQIGGWGISATIYILSAASKIPFASIRTITPSPAEWVIYIALIILIFNQKKIVYQKASVLTLAIILLVSLSLDLFEPNNAGKLELDFLDIGQGSSTFIRTPRGDTILVDGGGYASVNFDPGERIIAPFLHNKRIRKVDDIVISHPHADHYNGIPFIIRNFKPKRLWVVGHEIPPGEYQDMLTLAIQRKISIHTIQGKSVVHNEPDLEIICDNIDYRKNASDKGVNERGLLVTLRYGKTSVLLPGDIGVSAEQLLIRQQKVKQVNLLLAPHHGSKYSCLPDFIELLNPQLILVSAGKNKRGIYPAAQHLIQWRGLGIPWLVTSECGTIRCISDGKSFSVYPFGSTEKLILDPAGR